MKYLALLAFSLSLYSAECRLAVIEWNSASTLINPDLTEPDKLIISHTSFGCVVESALAVTVIHSVVGDKTDVVVVIPKSAITSMTALKESHDEPTPESDKRVRPGTRRTPPWAYLARREVM